jgi:hypothetical protein
MKMKAKIARCGAGLMAGLVLLLWGLPPAQAAVVTVDAANPYQDVGLVSGFSGTLNPFDIGAAGTYQVRLTDFAFPADPFDTLRLIITSATEEYARLDGPGSFLFVADPGHYFVSLVWGTAGDFDMGLYGVEIAASVVPVPSSVIMLMSAIGVLAFLRFRRRRYASDAAPQAAVA